MLLDPSSGSKTTQLMHVSYMDWASLSVGSKYSLLPLVPTSHNNGILNLLRDHHTTLSRSSQSIDHNVIRQNIELLLVIARGVRLARQTDEVDQPGFPDVRCDVFGRDLQVYQLDSCVSEAWPT